MIPVIIDVGANISENNRGRFKSCWNMRKTFKDGQKLEKKVRGSSRVGFEEETECEFKSISAGKGKWIQPNESLGYLPKGFYRGT